MQIIKKTKLIRLNQDEIEKYKGHIQVKSISFSYEKNTKHENKVLNNIDLEIGEGKIVGILGHTGSGKSTFIQHLNALIKPQEGYILSNGRDTRDSKKDNLKNIRQEVGMVFQYPENQLFEETVAKDIAFGPKNLKLTKDEVKERVRLSMDAVGLDYKKYSERDPLDLSGGEKRRVAIAGVIAMKPDILILDEPTAGLDPKGKTDILDLVKNLKAEYLRTAIIISHDIDEIVEYADEIIVFNQGDIVYSGEVEGLFKEINNLTSLGLDIPSTIKLQKKLEKKDIKLDKLYIRKKDLIEAIYKKARK